MHKKKIICYVAGHSGGHILPCLTLAQQQEENNSNIFFTSTKKLDQNIIKQNHIVDYHYSLPIYQKRTVLDLPLYIVRLIWSTIFSFFILLWHRPKRIITTGSIIAIPVCIAGWLLRIPIELFEVNAIPGKTISFLAPFAQNISICFPSAQSYFPLKQCTIKSYPIRFSTNKTCNIKKERPILFIQGGSQGSHEINLLMLTIFQQDKNFAKKIEIIHQAGKECNIVKAKYQKYDIDAYVFDYNHNLSFYYDRASLLICRAGAGTLFEALHYQKKSIIIPLNAAAGHQKENALAIAQQYPNLFFPVLSKNKKNEVKIILQRILSLSL